MERRWLKIVTTCVSVEVHASSRFVLCAGQYPMWLAFILNVEVIKVAQTMSSMHPEHSNIALSIMPRHPENRNVANGILSYGGSTT